MDPAIIAAIIGAIAGIIVAIIGILKSRQSKAKVDEIERKTSDASKALRDDLIDTYGYKTSHIIIKMQMTDMRGAIKTTNTYKGVKVIEGGVSVTHFPQKVWVDHPDGRFIKRPHFTDPPPSLPTKAVELRPIKDEEKYSDFNIEITGGLTANDPGLDYEIQSTISKALCVTREEMEETYKKDDFNKEYYCYDVKSPIDILDLEVTFPEGYLVQAYPMVFYFNSEVINNHELENAKAGFSKNIRSAQLRIDQPKVGFRYAIFWLPPPKKKLKH